MGLLLVLLLSLALRLLRSTGWKAYEFKRSWTVQLTVFIYNQVQKVIEASLLTILITNLIFYERPILKKKWDVFSFFQIAFINITFAAG